MNLGCVPQLFTSSKLGSPVLIGLRKPVVVVPDTILETAAPSEIKAILIHEFAHLARHDPWLHMVQRAVVILFWFHPLVHLLKRKLSQAREEVCDNFVLEQVEPASYADMLLHIEQSCRSAPSLNGSLAIVPRGQNLERRITDLLDERRDPATHTSGWQRISIFGGVLRRAGRCFSNWLARFYQSQQP